MSPNWLLLGEGPERLGADRPVGDLGEQLRQYIVSAICRGSLERYRPFVTASLPAGEELLRALVRRYERREIGRLRWARQLISQAWAARGWQRAKKVTPGAGASEQSELWSHLVQVWSNPQPLGARAADPVLRALETTILEGKPTAPGAEIKAETVEALRAHVMERLPEWKSEVRQKAALARALSQKRHHRPSRRSVT